MATAIAKKADVSITEGVIWKQLLRFFFPIFLGTLFQQMYNTVDALIIGQFVGDAALAAVGGSTGTLINLIVGFFVGLASGGAVIVSQYYGANDPRRVSEGTHAAIAISLWSGVLLTILGVVFTPAILHALETPASVLEHAIAYTRIYFSGISTLILYNMGAAILRASGDSRSPMLHLIVGCLVNIVLDLLFIVVFSMGVRGAGYGTIIAQTVSAALTVRRMCRTESAHRLDFKKIKLHPIMVKRIFLIGVPAGLQSMMYAFANLLIQVEFNSFGQDTVAAWTAFGKIDGIIWLVMGAFGIAVMTFVGQNYGAGRYDRVVKGVRITLLMSAATIFLFGLIIQIYGETLLNFFTQSPNVVAIGMQCIRILSPYYWVYVFVEILSGALRGVGISLGPTIITCVGICGLRLGWVYTILPIRNLLSTMLVVYPMSWVVTSALFIAYFLLWKSRNLPRDLYRPVEKTGV